MNANDAREMERIAQHISSLLDGLGGPAEVLDYQVQHFRAVLDGDEEAAARARRRTEVLAASLAAGSELLSVYDRALVLRNIPLARATLPGSSILWSTRPPATWRPRSPRLRSRLLPQRRSRGRCYDRREAPYPYRPTAVAPGSRGYLDRSTSTVERMARLLESNTTQTGEKNDMNSSVPNPFSERADMAAEREDERSLIADIGGEPVALTPQPDGSIKLTRRGDAMSLTAPSLSELEERFEQITGQPVDFSEAVTAEPDATVDLAAGEDAYRQWRATRAEQGIDLSLAVGQPVEWGTGEGKGHGILVEEVDTSEGIALVHTTEVIPAMGDKPAGLSPTGRTIKIDASKLRASTLSIVGENPVGPELSADLSAGDDGAMDFSDQEMEAALDDAVRRMRGGFGE